MDLITIKMKQEPQEETERKYPNRENEQEIISIEPKREEDVTSFLTQHQFIINEDVDTKKEHSVSLHEHDYVIKRQEDSSFCNEQRDISTSQCATSTTNFITEKESPSNSSAKLKCAYCRKGNLVQHVEAIDNFKQFKCDQNDFMSSYKQFLAKRNRQGSIKYKCDKCDYTKMGSEYLSLKFSCVHCSYTSWKKSDLVQHVARAHNLKQCDLCGFATACKEQLVSHIKSQHGLIECNLCNYGLISKNYLESHMKVCLGLKNFICAQCNYISRRKLDLREHMRSVHNSKEFICYQCGFATTSKERLFLHIKNQHVLKEYKCKQCNYASSRKRDLAQHVTKIHNFKQ